MNTLQSIEEDGWKITDLAQSLFPGGPSAMKVESPCGTFLFGMNLHPGAGYKVQPQTARISSFGIVDFNTAKNLFEGDVIKRTDALSHVCALLVAKGEGISWGASIVSTEFTEGSDTQVEIF
jgi:hypothetical protein